MSISYYSEVFDPFYIGKVLGDITFYNSVEFFPYSGYFMEIPESFVKINGLKVIQLSDNMFKLKAKKGTHIAYKDQIRIKIKDEYGFIYNTTEKAYLYRRWGRKRSKNISWINEYQYNKLGYLGRFSYDCVAVEDIFAKTLKTKRFFMSEVVEILDMESYYLINLIKGNFKVKKCKGIVGVNEVKVGVDDLDILWFKFIDFSFNVMKFYLQKLEGALLNSRDKSDIPSCLADLYKGNSIKVSLVEDDIHIGRNRYSKSIVISKGKMYINDSKLKKTDYMCNCPNWFMNLFSFYDDCFISPNNELVLGRYRDFDKLNTESLAKLNTKLLNKLNTKLLNKLCVSRVTHYRNQVKPNPFEELRGYFPDEEGLWDFLLDEDHRFYITVNEAIGSGILKKREKYSDFDIRERTYEIFEYVVYAISDTYIETINKKIKGIRDHEQELSKLYLQKEQDKLREARETPKEVVTDIRVSEDLQKYKYYGTNEEVLAMLGDSWYDMGRIYSPDGTYMFYCTNPQVHKFGCLRVSKMEEIVNQKKEVVGYTTRHAKYSETTGELSYRKSTIGLFDTVDEIISFNKNLDGKSMLEYNYVGQAYKNLKYYKFCGVMSVKDSTFGLFIFFNNFKMWISKCNNKYNVWCSTISDKKEEKEIIKKALRIKMVKELRVLIEYVFNVYEVSESYRTNVSGYKKYIKHYVEFQDIIDVSKIHKNLTFNVRAFSKVDTSRIEECSVRNGEIVMYGGEDMESFGDLSMF